MTYSIQIDIDYNTTETQLREYIRDLPITFTLHPSSPNYPNPIYTFTSPNRDSLITFLTETEHHHLIPSITP